jgi:hypothetical protein
MDTGTTCANERFCHDYKSALVALYVKCISLYGVLRGCQIAESLTEPDCYPEVDFSLPNPAVYECIGYLALVENQRSTALSSFPLTILSVNFIFNQSVNN